MPDREEAATDILYQLDDMETFLNDILLSSDLDMLEKYLSEIRSAANSILDEEQL